MLFNSYIFILVFLPLTLVGYFFLNRVQKYTLAKLFLLGMSLWFYGYFNVSYLLVIASSVLVNYLLYRTQFDRQGTARKGLLALSLIFNLGLLMYFKYMDFFIETVNSAFKTDFPLLHIVLPLGISFFTFQQISFCVDAYRGEVKRYNFLDYACYVTYFPQLIAGPIVTHDELIPQLEDPQKKTVNWDNMAQGLFIFSEGLVKKTVFADTLGNIVNPGYLTIAGLNSTNALITIFAYTLQIYFDFSGYCDMAIGIAKMMNIDLPLNFNSPYKACSISEFWDRWHMTLTRFFTKYVYIPLGGNRKGTSRTYVNIFTVFFLSGFWHGAGFTFILWGIGHGILSILNRLFKKQIAYIPSAINWLVTFFFVNILWVFFRAETIADALLLIRRAFAFKFGPISVEIADAISIPEMSILGKLLLTDLISTDLRVYVFLAICMIIVLFFKNSYEKMKLYRVSFLYSLETAILLVWGILSLSGVSTFLYFDF